jgi:hypothetical protein
LTICPWDSLQTELATVVEFCRSIVLVPLTEFVIAQIYGSTLIVLHLPESFARCALRTTVRSTLTICPWDSLQTELATAVEFCRTVVLVPLTEFLGAQIYGSTLIVLHLHLDFRFGHYEAHEKGKPF